MEVWDTSLDEIGRLLMEIASARARDGGVESVQPDGAYLDTGLTPAQLLDLCRARWVEESSRPYEAVAWDRPVVRSAFSHLHDGMFRFYVTVQEARGRLLVLDAGTGERHVFVARACLLPAPVSSATAIQATA